ncbi:MAG: glycosyltransferase family 2 protein [Pseudomonadota bacterium]|nr:glycosyltransferase family 2 protein [Pseudomonadota bacterium]
MEAAKVGVMVPTFNRPDLLRSSVLQLASQSRPPDVICVFQNGNAQSYQWAVEDLRTASRLIWMHTAQRVRQHDWYAVPLRQLLELNCTHFFWADDDDLYLHDHVASGLAELEEHDFSVSRHCGLLFTRARDFRYRHEVEFTSHAPGGMSSTMCFNRAFAQELLRDISADTSGQYTDGVLARVTMPKFRCHVSGRRTSIYHAHDGSTTSQGWLDKAFEAP